MVRMRRQSTTRRLIDLILGQHVLLAVASHYARTQLAAKPRAIYDPQHFIDMVDLAAAALVKVAPIYTHDAGVSSPRRLTESELEDAVVERAATVVVLRDGRRLSNVSLRRGDLRQAVAHLKALGVPELQARESVAAPARFAPAPMPPG